MHRHRVSGLPIDALSCGRTTCDLFTWRAASSGDVAVLHTGLPPPRCAGGTPCLGVAAGHASRCPTARTPWQATLSLSCHAAAAAAAAGDTVCLCCRGSTEVLKGCCRPSWAGKNSEDGRRSAALPLSDDPGQLRAQLGRNTPAKKSCHTEKLMAALPPPSPPPPSPPAASPCWDA